MIGCHIEDSGCSDVAYGATVALGYQGVALRVGIPSVSIVACAGNGELGIARAAIGKVGNDGQCRHYLHYGVDGHSRTLTAGGRVVFRSIECGCSHVQAFGAQFVALCQHRRGVSAGIPAHPVFRLRGFGTQHNLTAGTNRIVIYHRLVRSGVHGDSHRNGLALAVGKVVNCSHGDDNVFIYVV